MNQNYTLREDAKPSLNHRIRRLAHSHRQAEILLREIAFVLKMTERVRSEIETEQESRELVFA